MTLEGAIKFHETDSYIIYTMNSSMTGQYCVILPKNVNGVMNMLVDLHMKGSFDTVSTGAKTKEQLVEELGKEYLDIKSKYLNAIMVFPMIDVVTLQGAIGNNDKQKMFDEVKKIGAITSEIYKKLTDSGIPKQNIDQKIIIVEKNENDGRFVEWLKEQMPNFVDGIRYSDFEQKEVVMNPFVAEATPTVSTEFVVSSSPVGNSIFDNVAPSAPSAPITPVPEPVVPTPSVANSAVDIFGTSNNVNSGGAVAEPVAQVQNVSASSISTPEVVSSVPVNTPVVEAPQPVNSVGLDGTTTFSPISNVEQNMNVTSEKNDEIEEKPKNGSKGFVNLIILVVVLVGVTIASIELGKFLYNVYGA